MKTLSTRSLLFIAMMAMSLVATSPEARASGGKACFQDQAQVNQKLRALDTTSARGVVVLSLPVADVHYVYFADIAESDDLSTPVIADASSMKRFTFTRRPSRGDHCFDIEGPDEVGHHELEAQWRVWWETLPTRYKESGGSPGRVLGLPTPFRLDPGNRVAPGGVRPGDLRTLYTNGRETTYLQISGEWALNLNTCRMVPSEHEDLKHTSISRAFLPVVGVASRPAQDVVRSFVASALQGRVCPGPNAPPTPPTTNSQWPWVVTASTGLVLVGAGIYSYKVSNDITTSRDRLYEQNNLSAAEETRLLKTSRRHTVAGHLLVGAGAAMAATGFYVIFSPNETSEASSSDHNTALAPTMVGSGPGLLYTHTFK